LCYSQPLGYTRCGLNVNKFLTASLTGTLAIPAGATPMGTLGVPADLSTPAPAGSPGSRPVPDNTNVGAIAGGVVGGVLGLAIILFLFWFLRRKQKKKPEETPKQPEPPAFALSEKDATPNPAAGRFEKDGSTRAPDASELENPDNGLAGYYKSSPHQQPGERAELT
jgi:hypothetical protein